jgi:hypothetical protein
MIGSKKLSTIRDELRAALDATGDDPVAWLEKRMTAAERQGPGQGSAVLNSLRRFLEAPRRARGRRRRVGTKK